MFTQTSLAIRRNCGYCIITSRWHLYSARFSEKNNYFPTQHQQTVFVMETVFFGGEMYYIFKILHRWKSSNSKPVFTLSHRSPIKPIRQNRRLNFSRCFYISIFIAIRPHSCNCPPIWHLRICDGWDAALLSFSEKEITWMQVKGNIGAVSSHKAWFSGRISYW
jgi:hypothetical protein